MDYLNNSKEPPKIRVVVRKRPLTVKELSKNDTDIMDIIDCQTMNLKEMK